jgi:hypothetical protein
MLSPNTVYYLEPGTHIGSFAARTNDAFVGGYYRGEAVLSGNYAGRPWAVDSNSSHGDQRGVTIEYLDIERYQPPVDAAALNQDGNTGWTISYNTIKFNVPGAGTFAATGSRLRFNCLTLNGQYGFQSAAAVAADRLTTGPYNIIVRKNTATLNAARLTVTVTKADSSSGKLTASLLWITIYTITGDPVAGPIPTTLTLPGQVTA